MADSKENYYLNLGKERVEQRDFPRKLGDEGKMPLYGIVYKPKAYLTK